MLHPQPQQDSILQRKEVPDGLLVGQALAGDQSAFELLVNPYHHRLVNHIQGFLKDHDRSYDVLQQVYLQLYLSLPILLTNVSLKPGSRARPRLPLARTWQDAVRGRCGGNAAAEDDRERGRAGLRRVRRAFPLVGGSRASVPGGSRKRAQAIRTLEAKGAGIPATRAVDRGARGRRSPHARGIRAPAGHWPLHRKRGPGRRVRARRTAPRCQYGPPPGAVTWIIRGCRGKPQTHATTSRSPPGEE
jgi:hypothetical protein